MSSSLHINLTPEQLDEIAHGKVVNLTFKGKSDCSGTQLSEESAAIIGGGICSPEEPACVPWDFSMEGGNNNPFAGMSVGFSIGLGPVVVGIDVGACSRP